MRIAFNSLVLCTQLAVLSLVSHACAQNYAEPRIAAANSQPAKQSKFHFLMFTKDNSPATQAMGEQLQTAVDARSDRAEWSAVNVTDPANRAIVEQYKVGRAPMPLTLCVAPNGVVTGALRQINDLTVDNVLVTPAMAEVAKGLQEQKIVIANVQTSSNAPQPACVSDFLADPMYSQRTVVVNVAANDPSEQRYLADLKFNESEGANSMLVVYAPPGAFVGKFAATATKDEIAGALHNSGKCCNDPNCKHNR